MSPCLNLLLPSSIKSTNNFRISLNVTWWLVLPSMFSEGAFMGCSLYTWQLSVVSQIAAGSCPQVYSCRQLSPLNSPCWHWYWLHICTGFDIDTPDDFGRTCLHAAAAGGWVLIPAFIWYAFFILSMFCVTVFVCLFVLFFATNVSWILKYYTCACL